MSHRPSHSSQSSSLQTCIHIHSPLVQVAPFLGWCPEASKRGTPRPDNCYVLYDGGAFAPGSGGAEYPLLPLVWGEDSAGLTGGGKGEAGVKGRDVVLAAGFQGRHNARAVFLASYTAVSDAGFFTRRGNGPLMEVRGHSQTSDGDAHRARYAM